uniref:Uncharacterized protein n=1 Tax=Arundo donax TaxID=35708 RepID=A0A0A9D9A1_ARUDO
MPLRHRLLLGLIHNVARNLGDRAGDPDADRVVAPGLEHRRVVEASLARLPLPRRHRASRRGAGLRRCLPHLSVSRLSLSSPLSPPPLPL